jgi:lycopene elongase/hydratase (dihydrobisanhydrobacterioruberin-forming)
MTAHTVVGCLLAVGLAGAARGERVAPALLGLLLWVVCLNGGTLALNSAFDRDEGDIAYLRHPPPPPANLAGFSLALMGTGQILAFRLAAPYPMLYGICFVLSLAYSVPPLRLKAVAGADWLINMWGFGTLTPAAGWAATGMPFEPARGLVLLAFCPLFAALYPLTQLYQVEEDLRRGDRTLASALGIRRSLSVALGAALVAGAIFAAAGVQAGWRGTDAAWRWAALAIALCAWALVLVPWRLHWARWTAAEHQRGMYQALGAWAVTDLAVVLAWGT